MNTFDIKPYHKTGEFRGTVDLTKKEVDWNILHTLINTGCHCIWVKSDLESYIEVYGLEKHCVHNICTSLTDYLEILGGTDD